MQSWKWHCGPHPLSLPSVGPAGAESVAQWQWACLSRACMKGLSGGPLLIVLYEKSPGISSSRVSRQLSMSHSTGPTQQGWVAPGCALFDFDLPDITSIDVPPSWLRVVGGRRDRRPRNPGCRPGGGQPLHYPGLLLTSSGWWIFHGPLRLGPNHCCHLQAAAVSTDHGNHKSGYRGTQEWQTLVFVI